MLRRVVFVLRDHRSLVTRAARSITEKPHNDPKPTETQPNKENLSQEPLENEDPSKYEDFGDVKIRKGGRTIKVDESEVKRGI